MIDIKVPLRENDIEILNVLKNLKDNRGYTGEDVAKLADLSLSVVSKYLIKLERDGLVSRTKAFNKKYNKLTPYGKAVLETVKLKGLEWYSQQLSNVI